MNLFFFPFTAAPAVYGSSQARGQIGAAAVTYATAMATPDLSPCLQPTPQLTATPDP